MLAAVIPITNDFERLTLKRLFAEGNVNIKSTDSGQTALMLAVRHGNKDTVGLLLEASADCNLQDKEGSTALMAACEHGHIDIVRLLLDNTNCDPDIKDNVIRITLYYQSYLKLCIMIFDCFSIAFRTEKLRLILQNQKTATISLFYYMHIAAS